MQLIADFDNGSTAQDALGRLINKLGLGIWDRHLW